MGRLTLRSMTLLSRRVSWFTVALPSWEGEGRERVMHSVNDALLSKQSDTSQDVLQQRRCHADDAEMKGKGFVIKQ